jgi:Zn ribbon nucleic-acid-binding protein
MKYIQPEVFLNSFTCPHCGAIAKQDWWMKNFAGGLQNQAREAHPLRSSKCQHCNNLTIWIENKMYYPDTGNAPFPNPEMPKSVLKLYQEASAIHTKSHRGAAALLRLSIQVLAKELGEPGKNINTDIGSLVKKGLPEIVQQSLDIVRVTGNDAVHPGQIDTDDPKTVGQLFDLVNIIVEYMIALPNKVSGIYNTLPPEKKEGIQNRDN